MLLHIIQNINPETHSRFTIRVLNLQHLQIEDGSILVGYSTATGPVCLYKFPSQHAQGTITDGPMAGL